MTYYTSSLEQLQQRRPPMDPISQIMLPGVAGGLIVAYLLVRLNHRSAPLVVPDPSARDRFSTDIINIAHIRVFGAGALGVVVVCAIVAAYIPMVGLSLAAGFVLGALLAAVLILRRRKSGPMPSSSQRPGANTLLSIDSPVPTPEKRGSARRVLRHVAGSGARG